MVINLLIKYPFSKTNLLSLVRMVLFLKSSLSIFLLIIGNQYPTNDAMGNHSLYPLPYWIYR